jgi:hypothetical protein
VTFLRIPWTVTRKGEPTSQFNGNLPRRGGIVEQRPPRRRTDRETLMKLSFHHLLATAGLVAVTATSQAQTPEEQRVDQRQQKQEQRIDQGVKSGALTPREARRMERQQARVDRQEQRALADGKVTNREAARIERRQDHTSRHIYRQKHDRQARPS